MRTVMGVTFSPHAIRRALARLPGATRDVARLLERLALALLSGRVVEETVVEMCGRRRNRATIRSWLGSVQVLFVVDSRCGTVITVIPQDG